MRQIVLDTETTGLNPQQGHRMIEIGCVELVDRQLTGGQRHYYFNPDREVPAEAIKIHGITNEFLLDKPRFYELVDDIVHFVSGAELIIHNAAFDMGFLNHELTLLRRNDWGTFENHCTVLDTLQLAKSKHPGQRNSLDALCKRYDIDNRERQLHGALLDAELLAWVYLAMTGGQTALFTESDMQLEQSREKVPTESLSIVKQKAVYDVPVFEATELELAEHQAYIEQLKQVSKKEEIKW